MTTWVELSSGKDEHGGRGWEFGTCLWSPTKTRLGQTRNYGIMLQPAVGEYVINCEAGIIKGTSVVSVACRVVKDSPPAAGPWRYSREFYRVELTAYEAFKTSLPLRLVVSRCFDTIRDDIDKHRPTYYPFSLYPKSDHYPNGRIHVSQGRFLAKSTSTLSRCISSCLDPEDRTRDQVKKALTS